MPSPISPFYEKELKAKKAAAPLYRAQTERMGMLAEAEALKAAGERDFLTKGRTSTAGPAPAKIPYLPEEHREGRLGDIMRASPGELEKIFERMPTSERPVHAIRGTKQSWFSPGTKREYGDLRTAMTGFRPQPAAAAKTRAEAEEIRHGTEFKRGLGDVLTGTVEARRKEAASTAEEAELGVSEIRRNIRLRDEAEAEAGEAEAARIRIEEDRSKTVLPAKPGRTINPALKRAWRLSPVGAAFHGYKNIADWLAYGAEEGAEWAFPRIK